jgi:uncharacterized protein YegL
MTDSELSIMPGGGISRRPLHILIVADHSGSMEGAKMQALNFAIANMLPHLAEWEREQERAAVLIRVLAFANTPAWHVEQPVPVSGMRWRPLTAVPKGRTNLGAALMMIADVLSAEHIERRALRPAVVLITDGLPTDRHEDLEAGFAAIASSPGARSAVRLAVAIGRDARSEALVRFIGDPSMPVLVADNTDEIADQLVAASIAVSRLSEAGVDREALVGSLLVPPADPWLSERETIV